MDDDFEDFDDIADEDLLTALNAATSVQDNNYARNINSYPGPRSTVNEISTTRSIDRPPITQRNLTNSSSQGQGLRQTTLWGQNVQQERQAPAPTQQSSSRPYRGDKADEPPTHHELERGELQTWVYPTNLGAIRDYQFSIVKSSLFSNTLVALPTGLGKTFIAATVILNFFRWTKRGKIIFVAPTKPLVAQQVEACLQVAGVPRSQATLLTGETPPVLREDEWATKRLFFMTPQTLINDLSKGYADPKSVVLLVVDEAHRATGDYAYVKVAEFLRRFNRSFRVLALTATPGSTVERVQDIIDNLGISHIEIRTEESIDIRQYVHSRSIDTVVFDPSDEMILVRDLFSKALKPLVDKLCSMNCYYNRDPMSLTLYGMHVAQQEWINGPGRQMNEGLKGMIRAIFSTLQTVAHAIKLLNFHGIKPFYENICEFRSTEEGKDGKGSKYRRQLLADENFQEMMTTIQKWTRLDGFISHPKLGYLCDTLLNHFMDAGQGSSTRAIVFSEYRDSAEDIVRILNAHKPLISAAVFVGQADSKRSQGMKQKEQIETIEKFRNGAFNVLVATSIGEEGLDIGQVDLIVCYDASASPIRMLQRMGRTGRKRAGNVVLLLLKGKEEEAYAKAQDNYSKMQAMICEGSRFTFRHDLSARILPRDIKPEVDKRHVEIPFENTQNTALPEPKKSAGRVNRKPAKKVFHMPDGVETGFTTAAASFFGPAAGRKPVKPAVPPETAFLVTTPPLHTVTLNTAQTDELDKLYRQYPSRDDKVEEIEPPRLDAFPVEQRRLRPTVLVKHGQYTRRRVKLFRTLGRSQEPADRYTYPYGEKDPTDWDMIKAPALAEESEDDQVPRILSDDEPEPVLNARTKKTPKPTAKPTKSRPKEVQSFFMDEDMDEDEEEESGGTQLSEDDNTVPSVRPATRGGRSRASAGRGSRGRARGRGGRSSRARADPLEERGDDCMRTSDIEQTDTSDDGADLEDFLVGDDVPSSMLRNEEASSISSSPIRASSEISQSPPPGKRAVVPAQSRQWQRSQGYGPVVISLTQGSDSSMPDLDSLLGGRSQASLATARSTNRLNTFEEKDEPETDGDDVVVTRQPPGQKRRRVVVDTDDDDE